MPQADDTILLKHGPVASGNGGGMPWLRATILRPPGPFLLAKNLGYTSSLCGVAKLGYGTGLAMSITHVSQAAIAAIQGSTGFWFLVVGIQSKLRH